MGAVLSLAGFGVLAVWIRLRKSPRYFRQVGVDVKVPSRDEHDDTQVDVVVCNDDTTPFEFVVEALCAVFEIGERDARTTARAVHQYGRAPLGVMSAALAAERIHRVRVAAAEHNFPLSFEIRPSTGSKSADTKAQYS